MEKTMKRILITLAIAILLPVSAFSAKKKDSSPPPDATDWLNAPTPDGSPTLKETSDWLAKTWEAYGGDANTSYFAIHIDNDCSFHMSVAFRNGKHMSTNDWSFPLGAVSSVDRDPDHAQSVKIATGNLAAVQVVRHGGNNRGTNYYSYIWYEVLKYPAVKPGGEIPQPADQMLPHIVNAFQHAVNLCHSAYKAPTAAKDPF
jgi:hypothetical protein